MRTQGIPSSTDSPVFALEPKNQHWIRGAPRNEFTMTKSAKNTGVRVPLIVYRRGAFTSISVFICEARFLPTSRTLHILPPSSSLTKKSDYRLEGRDVEEGSRHQRTRQICERVLRQVREVDKRGSPVFRGGWGYEAAETTCSSRWWSV